MSNPLRKLPSVHEVLAASSVQALEGQHAHELVVEAVRAELDELRLRLRAEKNADGVEVESIAERVAGRLQRELQLKLREVINATGIILHTNLGRAPIAET